MRADYIARPQQNYQRRGIGPVWRALRRREHLVRRRRRTRERLRWEKELLGLYVSSHPLNSFRKLFEARTTALSKIDQAMVNKKVGYPDKWKDFEKLEIGKKTYFEKMAYLNSLDPDSYTMLVRAYFHIVENTVRANHEDLH